VLCKLGSRTEAPNSCVIELIEMFQRNLTIQFQEALVNSWKTGLAAKTGEDEVGMVSN
jgi:hypothetical protein